MEGDIIGRGELRRLRGERACHARIERADGVDGDEPPVHRHADGARAQGIALDRLQRQAEGRFHEGARDDKQHEQHDHRIDERGAAVEIKVPDPEHGRGQHALKTVRAAGQPFRLVDDFIDDERNAQRHHQAREIRAAQHEKTGDESDQRGKAAANEQADDRIAPRRGARAIFGGEARRIGTNPEKGTLSQRDNAGIAEHEVYGQREQAKDGNLAEQRKFCRQQKIAGCRDHPEGNFSDPPARAAEQYGARFDGFGRGLMRRHHVGPQRAGPRANRPCGRRISTSTMIV